VARRGPHRHVNRHAANRSPVKQSPVSARATEYERRQLALEAWAREEIAKLSLRPISVCPKPDDHLYEVARLQASIARVESLLAYVSEGLAAQLFGEDPPAAPSPAHEALLHHFTGVSL
jgi:hypothetical protein